MLLLIALKEVGHHTGEFQREDVLGGCTCTNRFKRLEVLQGHCLLVNGLGDGEDLIQGSREAFSAQELRLAFTFRPQDGALLFTFSPQNIRSASRPLPR